MAYRHSVIKSLQTGSVAVGGGGVTSNTATITAVVLAKSVSFNLGCVTSGTDTRDLNDVALSLTGTTTLNASRGGSELAAFSVGYQVAEFK